MSTNAYIAIPHATDQEVEYRVYCHYDGYPDHMLNALTNLVRENGISETYRMLLAGKEVRYIEFDGSNVEFFDDARNPDRVLKFQKLNGYTYRFEDGRWVWSRPGLK